MIGKFFNYIWRFFVGLMKALQVLIFFAFIVLIILIFRDTADGGFTVPDSAALVIAPTGVLVEQIQGEPLDLALANLQGGRGPSQTVVSDIVESLEVAATDDRIQLVVLLPQLLRAGGLSKLQAVGAALEEFKRVSGKPVIAMADNYDQTQYYLASRADEIYMHDFGLVVIEGFGYFKTYFADAIDKLKVDVNVFRVGEFKSFVEPYLRNDMSAEDKAAAERWLYGLWSAFQADVTTARELNPGALSEYVDGLADLLKRHDGDAAQAAMSAGLIDGLMSHQEFRDYIIELVGPAQDKPDEFSNIDFRTYLSATRLAGGTETWENNVGILVASGNIIDGEAAPGSIGSASLTRLIRQAANDDSIDALVLRVDSPGGSMFASEVIYDQLQELKALGKPLVVSMGSVAASGGYYISLPADEIWASATSISGSIGVGAIFPTFQRSLQTIGVNVDGFGTTELSGQFSGVLELNDEARELLDLSVQSAYDIFIAKVAGARGMQVGEVDEVARGRVWIGSDALNIGLVDRIGGLDDAVASAASLADLEEGSYGVKYVKRQLTISEQILMQYAKLLGALFGSAGEGEGGLQQLLQRLAVLLSDPIEALDAWNDPRGVYLHCFCELR